MISICKIKNSIREIDGEGWDEKTINNLDDAINSLRAVNASLENVSVKGRDNIDALLGCMLGIDMIIGEEDDNG